jgi:hypothetical protein
LKTICDQFCLTLFAIHLQGSGHLEYLNQDSDFSGDDISDLNYADDEIDDVITSTSTERIKAFFFRLKFLKIDLLMKVINFYVKSPAYLKVKKI